MRKVSEIDRIVGRNIRICRTKAGLSLTELGKAVGKTFQQLQKYETGTNRISASTLYIMAQTLNVSPLAFYAGLKTGKNSGSSIVDLVDDRYAVRLITAFSDVNDIAIRRSVVELLESIAANK